MTDQPKKTFSELCQRLGQRLNAAQNARLCRQAYAAYKRERGTAKGFSEAAARESGVSASQINALLQIGRSLRALPPALREALASSPVGAEITVLRKLAQRSLDQERTQIVDAYVAEAASSPDAAVGRLRARVGMGAAAALRAGVIGKGEAPHRLRLARGDDHTIPIGKLGIRFQVEEIADEHVSVVVTLIHGKPGAPRPFLDEHRGTLAEIDARLPRLRAAIEEAAVAGDRAELDALAGKLRPAIQGLERHLIAGPVEAARPGERSEGGVA